MVNKLVDFSHCDEMVSKFQDVIENPITTHSPLYYTGVDLGTACIVMAVMNEKHQPVAGVYQYADVVKDGMVVDYIGAIKIVRAMKRQLEQALGSELIYGAGAIPPGTEQLGGGAVQNIIEAAGFEVTNMLDEPTAANRILGLQNGAVVDIGGGTTGISIINDGRVVHVADEATGGTHFSLVLAGAYKMPFAEADRYKRDFANHAEILPLLKPVVEKISTIIARAISGYTVDQLVLVGGSSCLTGIERIIQQNTGIVTHKPANPFFVTPLGIAHSCGTKALR